MPDSAILEEWKNLRTEIGRKQAFAERMLVATGGINFAVLAFGLRDSRLEGVAVCLLPTIITSIVYLWLLTYIYSGFRIAAYIRTEIEPIVPGINWENWLSTNADKFKFRIKNPYSLLVNTFYCISLSAAVVKIALLYLTNDLPVPFYQSVALVVSIWLVWLIGIYTTVIRVALKDIGRVHRDINAD